MQGNDSFFWRDIRSSSPLNHLGFKWDFGKRATWYRQKGSSLFSSQSKRITHRYTYATLVGREDDIVGDFSGESKNISRWEDAISAKKLCWGSNGTGKVMLLTKEERVEQQKDKLAEAQTADGADGPVNFNLHVTVISKDIIFQS